MAKKKASVFIRVTNFDENKINHSENSTFKQRQTEHRVERKLP